MLPPKLASLDLMPQPFTWIEIPNKGYSMGKYPVTNAQFAEFIKAGGYKEQKWWTKEGWKKSQEGWRYDGKRNKIAYKEWTKPIHWDDSQWNSAEQPVVGVSWYEAIAFCLWLSDVTGEKIMLPTEEQWQYAAQGDDNRAYPWGDEWDNSKCRNSLLADGSYESVRNTSPVRQYEGSGDSPFGVVDMVGNVWEWCLTEYEEKTIYLNKPVTFYILRGCSWNNGDPDFFRCDCRHKFTPYMRNNGFGFRISRSN